MAVEFILIGLANAAIGHYGVKVFDWFDGRVRSAVGAEGEDAEAVAQRETPMESTERVKAALVSWYTNADEDQLTRLVDAALKPPHLNEVAPTEQLQLFRSRLRGIFEVAHTLPRGRAVVPGWFHSTSCVTLLDARSSRGSWRPEIDASWRDDSDPEDLARLDAESEHLSFVSASGNPDERVGWPRAWVIDAPDDESAAELASRLGAVLADPLAAQNRTLIHVLRACDIKATSVRRLRKVYEDKVELAPPLSKEKWIASLDAAFGKDPPLRVGFDAPDGVRSVQDSLRHQVLAVAKKQARWFDAI